MNLSRKTFLYSSILSGIILSLILIYFIAMLPSLYIDYLNKSYYQAIKKIQEDYIRDEDYNNIYSPNPSGTISVRIPESGKDIYASNSFGTAKITIKDKDLINLVDEVRDYSKNIDEAKEFNEYEVDFFDTLKNIFYKDVFIDELPIEFQFSKSNNNDVLNEGTVKMNIVSDNTIIYELNSFDGINYYTVYSAITINNENITLSLLTVMTPKIGEIRSIVFQSLPMIIAVIVLIILIATYYFSRKIIIPISKLANHAEFIKNNNITEVHPIEITGEDEISYLGNTLNDLYSKLNESFKALEEKNKQLIVENKRQDVFLRASSHQLKTPISAALLLVDGMIDEVGKYKNTKAYLPEVKTQLQSIRKIVDEILNLNNKAVNKKMVDIKELVDEILKEHEIVIRNKSIIVEKQLESVIKETDYHLIYKIIDNLISNATCYTENSNISINLSNERIEIINYGAHIEDELLPNIFDAFVSGSSKNRGSGLGLYIVKYYSNLLGYKIELNNISNGVKAILYFNF
ncbi:MAG: HAMP domain-containing histidine kinase [Clostridium sartagoforme]|nr:HAMP domain-containing histidine kinase [Clostridium sartagoforme]